MKFYLKWIWPDTDAYGRVRTAWETSIQFNHNYYLKYFNNEEKGDCKMQSKIYLITEMARIHSGPTYGFFRQRKDLDAVNYLVSTISEMFFRL